MDQLRQLQNIIQATSREIMWINDREEEELVYDWSDKNRDIPKKQESFSVSYIYVTMLGKCWGLLFLWYSVVMAIFFS